jgi:hypothetical protein
MNSDRIKEIQEQTAYPESVSVKQALLQVWNECEQKQLSISLVSKRLEMRRQASNVFELTKGFTTEPTDNAMKTALEMAHNVMVLTADLDGR